MAVGIEKHHENLELKFSANTAVRISAAARPSQLIIFVQAGSLRASLKKLEELLKEYSPLMNGTTERVIGQCIKFGAPFAEVGSPLWDLQVVEMF